MSAVARYFEAIAVKCFVQCHVSLPTQCQTVPLAGVYQWKHHVIRANVQFDKFFQLLCRLISLCALSECLEKW